MTIAPRGSSMITRTLDIDSTFSFLFVSEKHRTITLRIGVVQ